MRLVRDTAAWREVQCSVGSLVFLGRALQLTEHGALDGDGGCASRPEDWVIVEQANIQFRGFGVPVLLDAFLKAVPSHFSQANSLRP